MKQILLILGFLTFHSVNGQAVDFSQKWKDEVVTSAMSNDFHKVDLETVSHLDLSQIISNQKVKDAPLSTYIGIMGTNFHRIDFHLTAEKKNKQEDEYLISGKSNYGANIRELNGKMSLNTVLMNERMYDTTFIALFDYHLSESGNTNGNGIFKGAFSAIFFIDNGKLGLFWSAAGDYRELNNVFVGVCQRSNSNVEEKCVFSFHPAGLYSKLPYCEQLYRYDKDNVDFTYIKKKYLKSGWNGFDQFKTTKSDWWKN